MKWMRMRTWLAGTLGLLVLCSGPARAEPQGARAGAAAPAEPQAVYRGDPRFERPVRFQGAVPVGQGILELLHRETGASFLAEPGVLFRPLPKELDGRPAAALMDHLAEVHHATWGPEGTPRGETYVLIGDPHLLQLLELPHHERRDRLEQTFDALLPLLSYRQRTELNRRGELSLDGKEVSDTQRRVLRELGYLVAAYHVSFRPTKATYEGKGFSLRITEKGTKRELGLYAGQPPGEVRRLLFRPLPPAPMR